MLLDLERSKCLVAPIDLAMAAVMDFGPSDGVAGTPTAPTALSDKAKRNDSKLQRAPL
jgi:hypothetical protein